MGSAYPAASRCHDCFVMDGVVDHHSKRTKTKVNSSEMVGANGRAYYYRRCKKVRATNIESLSDDMLGEILVRVSADDICQNAKAVCRRWYHIIHSDGFASAHLHHHRASCGLFLGFTHYSDTVFLAMRQGRIEMSRMSYPKCKISIPTSCNGLVLWRDFSSYYPRVCHIVNSATKQALTLPPSPPQLFPTRLGIAYAASSMKYKVVRTYVSAPQSDLIQCDILTAGVDSNWRCVGVDDLSDGAKFLLCRRPLITEGFMHWTCLRSTQVLSLNVETETFTECYVPLHQEDDDDGGKRCMYYYLSTGRRLSLLAACEDWVWQVWEMEVGSGEWRKMLPNIDLKSQKGRVEEFAYRKVCDFLIPLGWVKYPVMLALCFYGGQTKTCFLYNLNTDELHLIQLPKPCRSYMAVVHSNTLEWLS